MKPGYYLAKRDGVDRMVQIRKDLPGAVYVDGYSAAIELYSDFQGPIVRESPLVNQTDSMPYPELLPDGSLRVTWGYVGPAANTMEVQGNVD
jgi:hypothetical protein